ncbi:hypothetical protein [Pedobacter sp. SL55]|uniref:hypothetical protein n=1 Tax=Pedobacter sp. SL55 TaxID=2995161 RepID=UPI00227037DB|nr:hypothetical protein [Pedobacter sp. SL55]WAC39364.1 hypothetical protein OVA16_12195 [Pedobacter sp. SL55]
MDILSSFICIIGINLLAFYLIGRYLCVLSLFDNKITVEFIYPFRIKKEYEFNGISEIDARGDNSSAEAMLDIELNLNRGFYRLYLTDANGKLLNIKYNISEKDNKEFISLLKIKLTELSTG